MRAFIFDSEIKNCIPSRDTTNGAGEGIEHLEYCDGWGDFEGMGISILGGWDTKTKSYLFFDDHNQDEFKKLVEEVDLTVGFNSIRFDNKLIKACWDFDIQGKIGHFDIRAALSKKVKKRKGTLDFLANLNLNYGKIGNGAMAPILWQRRKYAELVSYLAHDIKMTRDLFGIIMKGEEIVYNEDGDSTPLKDEVEEIIF